MSGGACYMVPGRRITIETVRKMLQERALVVLSRQSLLGHPALVF